GNLDTSYSDVASVLFHADDALVFIDPLVPDELWPELDAEVKQSGKPAVVLTTIFFHERNRDEVTRRYGGRVRGRRAGAAVLRAQPADEGAYLLPGPPPARL